MSVGLLVATRRVCARQLRTRVGGWWSSIQARITRTLRLSSERAEIDLEGADKRRNSKKVFRNIDFGTMYLTIRTSRCAHAWPDQRSSRPLRMARGIACSFPLGLLVFLELLAA